MQSSTFSKLSVWAVVLISIGVLIWLSKKVAPTVSLPALTLSSTTAPQISTSTAQTSASNSIDRSRIFTDLSTENIKAPLGTIHTLVADTPVEQEEGLSDRTSLPGDAGMIFPFATPGEYGFWMQNMNFPLDIIWIDASKKVVGMDSNLSPATYPSVFLPPSAISYVLEINSGSAKTFGIATGTKLIF